MHDNLVVEVSLLNFEIDQLLNKADNLAHIVVCWPFGGEKADLPRLVLQSALKLVFNRVIGQEVKLDLYVKLTGDTFVYTVDREPTFALLTPFLEHHRVQVEVYEAETGLLRLIYLANFNFEGARLLGLIVDHHVEAEE